MAHLSLCTRSIQLQDAHSYFANLTPLQKERATMLQKLYCFFCKEKIICIIWIICILARPISSFCVASLRKPLLQGLGGSYPDTEKFVTWVTASAGCAAALNQSVVTLTSCTTLWAPFSSQVWCSWRLYALELAEFSPSEKRANTSAATTHNSAKCKCCPKVPGRGCTKTPEKIQIVMGMSQ